MACSWRRFASACRVLIAFSVLEGRAAVTADNVSTVNRLSWAAEVRASQTYQWLEGQARQRPNWTVTSPEHVIIDVDHKEEHGHMKSSRIGHIRGIDERVVVKSALSSAPSKARWKVDAEIKHEIIYLERLRGLWGVPTLHGVWREHEGNGSSTPAYAVQLVGSRIGSGSGMAQDPFVPSLEYARAARERPYVLARAILRCFWSFAQEGGYFLTDFTPGQFTLANSSADGGLDMYLVDGPTALSSQARDVCTERSTQHCHWFQYDCLSWFRYDFHQRSARNAKASVATCMRQADASLKGGNYSAPCEANTDCPGTSWHICCCGASKDTRCQAGSDGAPETKSICVKPSGRDAGTCQQVKVTLKTHAFDVAAKKWLLPLAAAHAPALWPLVRRLRAPRADDRPDFEQALEMLDGIEASVAG